MNNDNTIHQNDVTHSDTENVLIEKGNTLLGLYTIESNAIVGGMGSVYRVHHTGWNVDLAMKQPKQEFFRNDEQKEAFIRECDNWIKLGLHPHIVSCYYVREIDGIPSIFAEWMDGGSLDKLIENGALYEGSKKEVLERILDISIQFARGLHYAHYATEKELIHQDVKPANLLLTSDGKAKVFTAKVGDFGIAGARAMIADINNETNSSGGGTVVVNGRGYTPAYCSPEQKAGKELTRRTDIWSWAVSVLEMFWGDRPWFDGTIAGMACEDYFEMVKFPISEAMKDLLRHCFQINEADRPHDFGVVEAELLKIYETETGNTYSRPDPTAASDSADSLNNRALSYLDLRRPEEAEKCWEEALKITPNHAECLYNRSVYLWRNAQIDDTEAIRLLTSGTTNDYYLARLHIERGDAESAVKCLDKAIEVFGETEDIKNVYGLALKMIEEGRDGRRIRFVAETKLELFSLNLNKERMVSAYYHSIEVWDTKTGKLINRIETDKYIRAVCISPCGTKALTGNEDKTFKLWNLITGECIRTFIKGDDDSPYLIIFSPDGKQALSTDANAHYMKLWDVDTGTCIRTFSYAGYIRSICFSPDGKTALSGGFDDTILWDISTGEEIHRFGWRSNSVCFTPDGSKALIVDCRVFTKEDCTKLFDITSGNCIRTFYGHAYGTSSACFNPDGSMILTASGKEIKLWDTATRKCIRTYELDSEVRSAFFFSADNELICGSQQGIEIWSIPRLSGQVEMAISRIQTTEITVQQVTLFNSLVKEINDLIIKKDILTALIRLEELRGVRQLAGYDAYSDVTCKLMSYCIPNKIIGQTIRINIEDMKNICFSTDSNKALILNRNQNESSLKVWDINSGQCIRILSENENYAEDICFSPCGTMALSAIQSSWSLRNPSLVQLWDITTGECIHTFNYGYAYSGIQSIAFSPDGSKIYSATDGKMKVWDVITKECVMNFEADTCWFNPDGSKILTKHGQKLLDASSGLCIHTFERAPLCLSPDGRNFLIWIDYLKIGLWNIETKDYIRFFNAEKDDFDSACFNPAGDKILSGGFHTITLWDAHSGACLYSIEAHTARVEWVSFSPDGSKALSRAKDEFKIWDLKTKECIFALNGFGDYYSSSHDVFLTPKGKKIAFKKGDNFYIYDIDYDFSFPGWQDWNEGARPYLNIFLTLHPNWTEEDFNNILIPDLQNRGYGWLRPEGVRIKLDELQFGW